MMLEQNDPMLGFYDRFIHDHPESIDIARGFINILLELVNKGREEYREHCIRFGYGNADTMNILLP